METKKLKCPIEGLVYMENIADTHTFYTLAPDVTYKMRVRSMDSEDEDGNVAPCYLRKLAIPTPYDFEKNEMGIGAEII